MALWIWRGTVCDKSDYWILTVCVWMIATPSIDFPTSFRRCQSRLCQENRHHRSASPPESEPRLHPSMQARRSHEKDHWALGEWCVSRFVCARGGNPGRPVSLWRCWEHLIGCYWHLFSIRYLVIFLKFISSVVPTIDYDHTISA